MVLLPDLSGWGEEQGRCLTGCGGRRRVTLLYGRGDFVQGLFRWGNSIAYRQDTSKRGGAQSVNQLASHEVIQKPPHPPPTPK